MPDPRVEWRRGPDFAEIAEAIGVPTDCIVALVQSEPPLVAWTPDPDERTRAGKIRVWTGSVRRDALGIVHVIERVESPEMTDTLHAALEGVRREMEGES